MKSVVVIVVFKGEVMKPQFEKEMEEQKPRGMSPFQ